MKAMRFDALRPLFFLILGSVTGLHLIVGCDVGETTKPQPPDTNSADPGRSADTEIPWFQDITAQSGIDFTHEVGTDRLYFFPEIMSPGAAFFDYDLDGDLDIYLVNAAATPGTKTKDVVSRRPTNRLFQQGADGRFVDVTEGSGLGDTGYGMGVAIGDVNNDGYPDVYITNHGPDRLLLNRGDGTFVDITERAGIDNARWSASACFFDYDRDGWLDLFVTNYVDYHPLQPCRDAAGRLDYCAPAEFLNTSDVLYHNLSGTKSSVTDRDAGSGHMNEVTFADVSLAAGIAEKSGAGLGVVCGDFTGDGWPDIYVANDADANFLWVNQHDGTFRDEAVLLGVAYDALGRAQAGMGIAVGDINGDLAFDLFVTHVNGESNAVYLSSQGQPFEESSASVGVALPSFSRTGFGTAFVDFEHDGDLDLAVVNGRVRMRTGTRDSKQANSNSAGFWAAYAEPNQLFLNDGRGHFQPFKESDNSFTSHTEVSRALVCGDIDNDGDVDFLVTTTGGLARLFRNESPKNGHWLSIRAVDPSLGGRDAYGAIVTVYAEDRRWRRLLNPGSSYLASHDPRIHFGLGIVTAVKHVEVLWPDGIVEVFRQIGVDEFVVLARGAGEVR